MKKTKALSLLLLVVMVVATTINCRRSCLLPEHKES
ncbi:unnamed protein product [Brassica oleracea]